MDHIIRSQSEVCSAVVPLLLQYIEQTIQKKEKEIIVIGILLINLLLKHEGLMRG